MLPDAKAVVSATLKDRKNNVYKNETIGWIYHRKDSSGPLGPGRSFGFTGCHFHSNFGIVDFRRMIVNGILWTAGLDVPDKGAPVELRRQCRRFPTSRNNANSPQCATQTPRPIYRQSALDGLPFSLGNSTRMGHPAKKAGPQSFSTLNIHLASTSRFATVPHRRQALERPMLPTASRQLPRVSMCLLLMALCIPVSGCLAAAVTAGVVGAGAAGYAYYQGSVARDIPAGMDQTWAASQAAVTDLGMPLVSAVRDNDGGTIESRTGDGDKVKITLEPRASRVPADGQWIHVNIRVAMIGDGPLSERLLNQIENRVTPPGQAGRSVPVVATPTSIQTGPPPLAPR